MLGSSRTFETATYSYVNKLPYIQVIWTKFISEILIECEGSLFRSNSCGFSRVYI